MKKTKGLTLLELMVTLAILAIALIPISNLVMSTVKWSTASKDLQYATNLATKYTENLKGQALLGAGETKIFTEGDFTIECTVKEVSKYKPVDKGTTEHSTGEIPYDYLLSVEENGLTFFKSSGVGELIIGSTTHRQPTVALDKTPNYFNINSDNISKKLNDTDFNTNVRVKISRILNETMPLKININNKTEGELNIYIIQDIIGEANLINGLDISVDGGQVNIHRNLWSDELTTSDKSIVSSVYQVHVKVLKNGQLIIENKSLKINER